MAFFPMHPFPASHCLSHAVILFLLTLGTDAFAQDSQEPQKPDLSNPDAISTPPMDPYSLSYIPERPEGAPDITTIDECLANGGEWDFENKPSHSADLFVGCRIDRKRVGRWFATTCDDYGKSRDWSADTALGYLWYVDDKPEGWAVWLNAPNDFVRDLWHYHEGVYDGTNFHWDAQGALSMVVTYRNGVRHGRYEEYQNCIPRKLGQYEEGSRSGMWEYFCPKGMLTDRLYFNRRANPEDLPPNTRFKAVWAEGFFEGQKASEGYKALEKEDEKELLFYYVGNVQYFTPSGQKWFTAHYDSEGNLQDSHIAQWCSSDSEYQSPFKEIEIYPKDLCIHCVNRDKAWYRNVCFYGSGDLWKIYHVNNAQPNGMWTEYHPTGELLARYSMLNGVPQGRIEYLNKTGVPFGPASEIIQGTGHFKSWWFNGNLHEEGDYYNGQKEGDWTIRFENGSPEWERHYTQNKLNGEERRWYNNGVLSAVTPYTNGYKDGVKTWYYSDGHISGWSQYIKKKFRTYHSYTHAGFDQTHIDWDESNLGVKTLYYEDGRLQARGAVIPGAETPDRHGHWTYYLKNGNPWYEAEFTNDAVTTKAAAECKIIDGTYRIDPENREVGCSVCAVNRKHPLDVTQMREGEWAWYRETGKLEKRGTIHMGHLHGRWEYNYPNGSPMLQGAYHIDRKIGEWSGFYENGNPKFAGAYRDGKEDGLWQTFHTDGITPSSEGVFEAGRRTGEWKWFYAGGTVREQGRFDQGKETGIWTSYYENGTKSGEGAYRDGLREGEWIWWRPDGREWRRAHFKKGREYNESR